jgi:hypothetical protein
VDIVNAAFEHSAAERSRAEKFVAAFAENPALRTLPLDKIPGLCTFIGDALATYGHPRSASALQRTIQGRPVSSLDGSEVACNALGHDR